MSTFRNVFALATWLCIVAVSFAADELEKKASWSAPSPDQVKAQIEQWVASQDLDETTKVKIETLWSADGGQIVEGDLIDRVAATAMLVDERASEVVNFCRTMPSSALAPKFAILDDEKTPDWIRNNLRLLYGRALAQAALVDEALDVIGELKPDQVADPSALLFYQSVCYHRLLEKDKCLSAISTLLENRGAIPQRFETVAILMEADMKPLKTDSLDEIARLMDDVERRLGFGRAGTRVRKEEDDVIAKLDKMIEEMEKQQQQQQAAAAAAGGQQATQPMQDSMPGGGSGPGEVDQRRIGDRSGWGNLPPKQRQEALQQISKGLPSHYREVIEEYFRKLARDGND